MFRAPWGYYIKSSFIAGWPLGSTGAFWGPKQDPRTVLESCEHCLLIQSQFWAQLRSKNTDVGSALPGSFHLFHFKSPIATVMSNLLAPTYVNCIISWDEEI